MPKKCFFRRPKLPALWTQGVFLILGVLALTTPAQAHRVLVFAYAEGDTIHTEGKFVPNNPVRQGQVQVLEQKTGKILVTGKTDDQGKYAFKIPAAAAAQKMDLKIVIVAAMGHQGEWLLKASSYLPGAKKATVAPAPAAPQAAAPSPVAPGTKAATVDSQMLEEAVNKALARQLGPINEKLAEMAVHRASLPDILGGLGYILGFFGFWAYFQSKRKKDS
ncbi:MAG: hypothetical protein HY790_05165 [Deltaproteobacteria bacterium]|nr:hypothetical protein [Deltaproteobacteria bacterium]MBI4795218.1 hypothetical protein [Deltaproteobacteria bacterium]